MIILLLGSVAPRIPHVLTAVARGVGSGIISFLRGFAIYKFLDIVGTALRMNFLVVGLVKGRRHHIDIKGEYSHAAGEHVAKEPDAMTDVADVLRGVEGET